MRKILVLATSLAVFFGQDNLAQDLSAPFTLTIQPLQSSVEAGSELWVKVSMSNTSDHRVDCTAVFVNGTDRSFQYDVKNALGIETDKKSLHPETYAGSVQMCTLAPGETASHDTRISWLHDLTLPGHYQVYLRRGYSSGGKELFVNSNTVVLTVTPRTMSR